MMRKEFFRRGVSSRLVRRYQLGVSLLMIWWLLPLLWPNLLSTQKELLVISMAILNAGLLAVSTTGIIQKDKWIILSWISAGLSFFSSFWFYPLQDVYLLFPISICLGMIMAGLGTWSFLKRAEVETLDEFIQTIPVPVIEVDRQGERRLWNQAFVSAFMNSGAQLFSSDFSHHLSYILKNYGGKREGRKFEWTYNNRTYQVEVQASPGTGGYRIYFFDISQERDIEEMYRIIVEGTNEALVIVNLTGKITFVNQQFCKMFGYQKEELVGYLAAGKLVDDSDIELIQKRIQDRKDGKGEIYHARQKTKEGSQIWTLINASPYRDHTGKVVGTVAAITDLSQLMQVQDALHDRNEEMKMFLYKASHDIKGPLASIKGILKLALDEKLDPASRSKYINLAIESANKLDNAIADLVRVSQVHNQPLEISEIDFEEMLKRIMEEMKKKGLTNGVELEIETKVKIPFRCDGQLLGSVLENLIQNACTYRRGEEGHKVKINIRSYQKGVNITVADNGEGIREDLQDKVYNMFFRGNKDSVGTGLGLYIVKQVVRKLNGKLSFQSREGEGTTFRVYLPSQEESTPSKARKSPQTQTVGIPLTFRDNYRL
ncbi:MAG: PAS domain S-box protein [Bacteroidota bacterium]